jgi:polysaccharide pyruvyl transferase WcaK-like protein
LELGKTLLLALCNKLGINKSNSIIKELKKADLIIDMGGDTFSDYPSCLYSIIHSIGLIITILLDKKYVILSQSIGRFNNIITRSIAKYVLNRAEYIISREHITYNYLLNELKINPAKIKLVPDIGYLYPSKILDRENKTIGILTSSICKKQGGISVEENVELLTRIGQYYNDKGYKIYLIPHVLASVTNIGVNKKLDDNAMALRLTENIENAEIIDYSDISRASIIIGSRLHGCINALNCGVPVVALAYSNKFYALEGNAVILNMPDVLNDYHLVIDVCNDILGVE